METYLKIKNIVEKITGLEDISIKGKFQEYVIARAVCIEICCEECIRVHKVISSESFIQIGLTVGRDRGTAMYWSEKFKYWKTEKEDLIYNRAKSEYNKYINELKEVEEIEKIESKIKQFDKAQLIKFIPFLDRYMRLNQIAS